MITSLVLYFPSPNLIRSLKLISLSDSSLYSTSSIPSRHGVKHKLYHTPSVASSLYSTTTDDDLMTEHNSPMSRPKRSGLRSSDKRKIHALGTPAPSSMGLGGGLRMATEEGSSDDGSAWNGLGGKSDFEV